MAFLKWPDKAPEECLDYPLDWSDWLVTGALVDSVTHVQEGTSDPGGLTNIVLDSETVATPNTIAWLSGGTDGETYTMLVTATDDQVPERRGVRRVKIKVKKK